MNFLKKLWLRIRYPNAAAIGIIGSADGPTSIFIGENPAARAQQARLEKAAQGVRACERDFTQITAHLRQAYHAEEYPMSETERKALKINAMLAHFGAGLASESKKPAQLLRESEALFVRAQRYPAERLDLRAYRVPGGDGADDAVVELEMTTGYIGLHSGEEALLHALVRWRGVSQRDIDTRSARYQAYVFARAYFDDAPGA